MGKGTKAVAPIERQRARPKYWSKLVAYAYLRMQGKTQAEGAKGVGRSLRCVKGWEGDDPQLWSDARAEARELWMADAEDAARRAVLGGLQAGNPELGMRFLERVDQRLAPPKVRTEVSGPAGGPIPIINVNFVDPQGDGG